MTVPPEGHQRQSGDSNDGMMNLVKRLAPIGLILGLPLVAERPCLAQSEGWLLGPGSGVGKQSEIVPTNCVTRADGAIACDTKVRNPASDTQARPYYNPFND